MKRRVPLNIVFVGVFIGAIPDVSAQEPKAWSAASEDIEIKVP